LEAAVPDNERSRESAYHQEKEALQQPSRFLTATGQQAQRNAEDCGLQNRQDYDYFMQIQEQMFHYFYTSSGGR
jgi:hypothetical protein